MRKRDTRTDNLQDNLLDEAKMNSSLNAAMVWKREASKNERLAKLLTGASTVFLILLLMISVYAYSSHTQYARLCSRLASAAEELTSPSASKAIGSIVQSSCS